MAFRICIVCVLAIFVYAAPARASSTPLDSTQSTLHRRLSQTINFAAGTKFGPPENAFTLLSKGGPYSSIQGTRTTNVKAGAPPRPPVFQYSFDYKRSDAPAPKTSSNASGRKLLQTINFAAGTKFGPPENAFTLLSKGGPYSSIQGTRTTNVKAGAPPRPPVFQYSFNSKRSDAPAPKTSSKASGRKLLQTINFAAGAKFGPPVDAFTLVSKGGPYSSIQGTRTTYVKAGAPPSPPVFQYSFDSKRSDAPAPAPKSAAPTPKSKDGGKPPAASAPAAAPKAATPAAATPAPKTGATPAPAPKAGATPAPAPKSGATPAPAPKAGAAAPAPAPKAAATPAPTSKASGSPPAPAPKDDGASKQEDGDDE